MTRSARATLGFIAACVSAVAFYGILRVVQSLLFKEPNPATVIWSAHAGYFWRCWTVAYGGGLCGIAAYAVSRKHAERVAMWLSYGLAFAVAVLVLQSLFIP